MRTRLRSTSTAPDLVRRYMPNSAVAIPRPLDVVADAKISYLLTSAVLEMMRCRALPGLVHRGGHEIVFTHGDLNLRNVMVKDGKLSGVVDWATAGWYPEYWDYTKGHFVTKMHWRWLKMLDKVFEELGDYREELATEKKLWEYYY